MAGFKSNYSCNKILGQMYGGVVWTPPATLYCALFTAAPSTAGGGTEVAGNGYARQAVTNNTFNFAAPAAESVSNAVVIDFGVPTGSGWGTIVWLGWFDAPSGGNFIGAGPATPVVTANPGINFQVAIGGFVATER